MSREIGCNVLNLVYDFEERSGTLRVAADEWTDMEGCIELFSRIDPRVMVILVYNGSTEGIAYERSFRKGTLTEWASHSFVISPKYLANNNGSATH